MAWTYPMTFTANTVLTAAQLNTHLRDNLMETEAARAQVLGDFFAVDGYNRIGRRRMGWSTISVPESTTSTEYTDLNTVGPSVTVTTGTRAIVFMSCVMTNATANKRCRMSWGITSAANAGDEGAEGTSRDPLDKTSLMSDGLSAGAESRKSNFDMIESILVPGSNTFTAKYRVSEASTGTYNNRFLAVLPL